jgi:tetratricopeptide (TPR) repeat protein
MLQNSMTRFRWALTLLLALLPAQLACSQTMIDKPEATSSPIAALDLPSAEASQLTQALAAHDYTVAEKLLLDEINHDPHSLRTGRLLSFVGHVYFLNNDYLNAAIAWKKSEGIAPLDPSARFSLAMVYIKMGHSAWAEPLLQTLATDLPKQALYPYWLGRLDYEAGHYDRAIGHFQQALAIDPEMARAYDNLGLCHFYQNQNTLAIENYMKAIKLEETLPHPSAWPHLNLAITLQFLNRLDEAEAQLHEALRLDPRLAQAQYQLGTVLEARDQLDAAVTALREASRLDATYAEPHYALARIYSKLGHKALSQAEVKTYVRLHAETHPTVDPQVH